MYFIIYIVLVFQVGLRWESGTDWGTYLIQFNSINSFASTSPLVNGFEYGYNIFVWLSKQVTPDYSFFLLANAVIYYLLIFRSFHHYTPSLYLSLMMFYTLTMGLMGSNRQLFALALCLYALRFIIEKKPIWFFILVFIAANFHTSAVLFIVYYFLNRKIVISSIIIILACTFVIGKSQLPIALFTSVGDLVGGSVGSKVLLYLRDANNILSDYKLSIFGLLKRLLFLSFFLYNREVLSKYLPYYNFMLNGYILGMGFYFLFADTLLVMVSRGSIFFNVMEPLLIASQIFLLKLELNRIVIIGLLLILSFFFFFKSIATYPDLFIPYKGVFINSGYSRVIY